VARVRSTQALRQSEDKRVVEDWHSKLTLTKVSIIGYYIHVSPKSAKEKGTMYQLTNLINRTSVPADSSQNMNAAEDFLLLLLHTHICRSC